MPHAPGEPLRLRPIEAADAPAVLALNALDVELTSPLDEARLALLLECGGRADVIECDGQVAGFVLTFGPGSGYDSVNYRWFAEHYADRFYYLDRIVIDAEFRRRGLASFVYAQLEAQARQHGRMALEVNIEPPNAPSLVFHRRRGYREVGRLGDPGHVVSLQVLECA